MARSPVTRIDRGRDAIEAMFKRVNGMSVKVGFLDKSTLKKRRRSKIRDARGRFTSGQAGPATVAEVAMWHEFGTVKMVARPFMRPVFVSERKRVTRSLVVAFRRLLRTKKPTDPAKELAKVGRRYTKAIKKSIFDLRAPPLRPATIAARQAATGETDPNPLVDTGQMMRSVTWDVFKGSTVVIPGPGVR